MGHGGWGRIARAGMASAMTLVVAAAGAHTASAAVTPYGFGDAGGFRNVLPPGTTGTNDLAEYRGYCLFLGVYAVIFGLVAYATYEHVFDD